MFVRNGVRHVNARINLCVCVAFVTILHILVADYFYFHFAARYDVTRASLHSFFLRLEMKLLSIKI